MDIRIANIIEDSIVDGPGLRLTVFTQGCPHHCKGCHNPSTFDPEGGSLISIDEILKRIRENPLLSGITLSGGEPFLQSEPLAMLAKAVKEMGLTVYTYTGFTLEKLQAGFNENPAWKELLYYTDVLIDEPFILEERTLSLPFRGSRNQRLIENPLNYFQ